MNCETLRRSAAAHRRDSRHARSATLAVTLGLSCTRTAEEALWYARTTLERDRIALEHLAEIEARARAGGARLAARENGARQAADARDAIHNRRS